MKLASLMSFQVAVSVLRRCSRGKDPHCLQLGGWIAMSTFEVWGKPASREDKASKMSSLLLRRTTVWPRNFAQRRETGTQIGAPEGADRDTGNQPKQVPAVAPVRRLNRAWCHGHLTVFTESLRQRTAVVCRRAKAATEAILPTKSKANEISRGITSHYSRRTHCSN